MVDMTAALRDRLKADAEIAAIVGPRVYRLERPQGEPLPALVIAQVSPGRTYTHDGAAGVSGPRVQFDCYSATRGEARALADAVIAEMEGPATTGGVSFVMAFLEEDRDLGEQTGTTFTHRQSLDFFVWWQAI